LIQRRILILAGKGASTHILYNSLKNDYNIEAVILEDPLPGKEFLKKRIKRLGIGKVIGQVLFHLSIAKYLDIISVKRKNEILKFYDLNDLPIPPEKVILLKSVNDYECIVLLKKINPELVIVNGTRIISKEVLNSLPVKFINIHAGITPKYRNVHGAYWAVVNNDMANCGVTVHLVDPGIDTGKIICQQTIKITKKDNFSTYPFLQLAEGIICLKKGLPDIFENKIIYKKEASESKLWYHPTFGQYLFQRIFHGKK
jgi:folate-dependent phosphoribosylglycinamide formyltransferase PurN